MLHLLTLLSFLIYTRIHISLLKLYDLEICIEVQLECELSD